MIKLKSLLLLENQPNIFIPRRLEGRFEKYIQSYIKNGSKGNLDLRDMNLTKLPDILKYINVVGGNFHCGNNNLISLEGCPKSVGRSFWCDNNQLTSLKSCPKYIGSDFTFSGNIKNLDHWPEFIGGKSFWYNGRTYFPIHIWLDQLDLPEEEKMLFKLRYL